MNREDIIKLAREHCVPYDHFPSEYNANVERLVQAAYAAGAAAEREACAKVVEDVDPSPNPIINMTNRLAAAAIRARSNT